MKQAIILPLVRGGSVVWHVALTGHSQVQSAPCWYLPEDLIRKNQDLPGLCREKIFESYEFYFGEEDIASLSDHRSCSCQTNSEKILQVHHFHNFLERSTFKKQINFYNLNFNSEAKIIFFYRDWSDNINSWLKSSQFKENTRFRIFNVINLCLRDRVWYLNSVKFMKLQKNFIVINYNSWTRNPQLLWTKLQSYCDLDPVPFNLPLKLRDSNWEVKVFQSRLRSTLKNSFLESYFIKLFDPFSKFYFNYALRIIIIILFYLYRVIYLLIGTIISLTKNIFKRNNFTFTSILKRSFINFYSILNRLIIDLKYGLKRISKNEKSNFLQSL